jgi:hypothetical protein
MLSRIARDTGLTCALLIVLSIAVWPGRWRIPLGVAGGGVLIGLSLWAIRGTVDSWLGGSQRRAGLGLVKFFTRYAMLGFAAYVMMARLHLDPVGMLAGVSALGVAAGAEALRGLRAHSVGRRG